VSDFAPLRIELGMFTGQVNVFFERKADLAVRAPLGESGTARRRTLACTQSRASELRRKCVLDGGDTMETKGVLRRTVLGLLAACGARAQAEPGVSAGELVIGQTITLQGGKNAYGVDVLAGANALFRDTNRAGGVGQRRIVLRVLDDDNKSAQAEANARKLIDEGAFLLFGSIEGGPCTAVMNAAVELGVPFFAPMAGSPALRRPHQAWVFPVRAEHRQEFRALVGHGVSIGLKRIAFFHSDSDTGRLHLENIRLAAKEHGATLALALPFGSDVPDSLLDGFVRQLAEQRIDMVLNHGSASLYGKLLRKAREAGLRTSFLAVNSGSTQLAEALGPLAAGLVCSQVLPNPWARKTAIVREYQESIAQAYPGHAFSYASLEGYVSAKALVAALKLAGPQPTRSGFAKALESATIDLGGLKASWRPGDHTGSTFVDLAMVSRDGRFIQ
jgi:ABC-type branched-subunit amino acid transport system substrate-binding protein